MNADMTWVLKLKLIAIVRELPLEQMEHLAIALLDGGIDLMEVTFNQAKRETWGDTAQAIKMLSQRFAGRILPGAGTVINLEQLALAHDAGAKYIISPNVNQSIIEKTKALGLLSFPGAMTPTEIEYAYRLGADAVKVFPIDCLGPAYIKAVKAPLSHIPLFAVGGVNENNASAYLKAGAIGLGVGGNLVNKAWIANGEFNKITAVAQALRNAVEA